MDKHHKLKFFYCFLAICTSGILVYKELPQPKTAPALPVSENLPQEQLAEPAPVPEVNGESLKSSPLLAKEKPINKAKPAVKKLWNTTARGSLEDNALRDDNVENYQEINVDLSQLTELNPGDIIELNIPQTGMNIMAKMEDRTQFPNGDISLSGHLMNNQDDHSVVFTIGEELSFGMIDTPNGTYLMEAIGNAGWLFASEDLEQDVDLSLNDSLDHQLTELELQD